MTPPPTLAELMAELKATPGAIHGYCSANTRTEQGDWLNCNRPLQHPRDFHADFGAPGLGRPIELRGVWPV